MRTIWIVLILSVMVFANTQPYKKEIVFQELDKPSVVRVKLNNEIYKKTTDNYSSVRLLSSQGVEGYFIKLNQTKSVANQKILRATSYDRKNAKLTYRFEKPFEIEKIALNIEDRNFESLVDLYIDGKLVSQNRKIFDYSQETGNRNFSLTVPKQQAKEVIIVYHLDSTTSFYKKYRDIRELSKYLTIKSVTFSNHNRVKMHRDSTKIELFETETKEKKTSYIFKVEGIPTHSIEPNVVEKNFKRAGQAYASNNLKEWKRLKNFSFSNSTLLKQNRKNIRLESRTRYIKLLIDNQDNKLLSINSLKILTQPQYLYFIANPNEKYSLYFGDKNLTKPSYEVANLVGLDASFVVGEFTKIERLAVTEVSNEVSFFEKYKDMLFIVVIFLALGVMGYIAFGLLRR